MNALTRPAWAVGTEGAWNWQVIRAADQRAAIVAWIDEGNSDEGCTILAERRPEWDAVEIKTGGKEWFEGGFGAHCSRCGYEAFHDDGGMVVGPEILCVDCAPLIGNEA